MAPPFRAEQIGSLLRPRSLIEARNVTSTSSSLTTRSEYLSAQNSAIAAVVTQQLNRSVRPITSGEYERHIFYSDFFDRLSGFELRPSIPLEDFKPYFPTVRVLRSRGATHRDGIVCSGPVRHVQSPLLDEWLYLRSLLPEALWAECKVTLPSPTYYHMQLKEGMAWKGVYESDEAFFADVAAAYRREFEVLYQAGVRNVQVDDPNMSFFCDDTYLQALKAEGVDAAKMLRFYVKVHNDCLKDLPRDMHVGIHICRGNAPNSVHYGSGSYEPIACTILNDLQYATYYLEFDTSRAGNFEPLRFLPKEKNVVLGLVTTKFPEMEDLDDLVARVHEAADVIARGQGDGRTREQVLQESLAVSPQCGFASGMVGGGTGVTEAVQWQKLDLVRRLADRVWS